MNSTSGRLTINGETVKLLGFNRHTMWPDTGAAVTPAQEAADLALLQKLNSNYVRGAHYPQVCVSCLSPYLLSSHPPLYHPPRSQSQSWLDALDEAGIVLWEESLVCVYSLFVLAPAGALIVNLSLVLCRALVSPRKTLSTQRSWPATYR